MHQLQGAVNVRGRLFQNSLSQQAKNHRFRARPRPPNPNNIRRIPGVSREDCMLSDCPKGVSLRTSRRFSGDGAGELRHKSAKSGHFAQLGIHAIFRRRAG